MTTSLRPAIAMRGRGFCAKTLHQIRKYGWGAPAASNDVMDRPISHSILTTLQDAAPKFLPRKGVLMREYHVLVTWPDGRRLKIGQFPRKPDAVRWIQQKSADWLAQYLETKLTPSDGAKPLHHRSGGALAIQTLGARAALSTNEPFVIGCGHDVAAMAIPIIGGSRAHRHYARCCPL